MRGEGFIAVHVGAGFQRSDNITARKNLCKSVCRTIVGNLQNGHSAVDSSCSAVALLENDPLTNAGMGSNLSRDGFLECDACVCDARSGQSGACGAVSGVKNPIMLANAILKNRLTKDTSGLNLVPPMLLSGEGAYRFAIAHYVDIVDPEFLITVNQRQKTDRLVQKMKTLSDEHATLMDVDTLDTVGAIAIDFDGNIASAVSSGGLLMKHRGRIGQAAIIGAGVWAEERAETSVACCTSGTGEHLVQTNLARELCSSVLADESAQFSDLLKEKFLNSKFITGNHPRYMAAMLLQVSDWKTDEKRSGFLQVAHSTPSFSWGMQSTKMKQPRIEFFDRDISELTVMEVVVSDGAEDAEITVASDNCLPLKMIRAVGFNGSVHDGLKVHHDGLHIIYPMGSAIIIMNTKSHKQVILSGHSNTITCVEISPSGKYIASGQVNHMGFKANVFIWDFEKRQVFGRHALHKVKVESVVFSHNEKYCVSMGGQDDGSVIIYDMASQRPLCGLQVPRTVQGVTTKFIALNCRDDVFIALGEGIIRVWEFRAKENRLAFRNCCLGLINRQIETVKIDSQDRYIFIGSRSGDVIQIELDESNCSIQPRIVDSVGRYLKTETQRQNESSWYGNGVTALYLPRDRPDTMFLGTGSGWVYEARIKSIPVHDPIKSRYGVTRKEPRPKNVFNPIRHAQLHGEITSIVPLSDRKAIYVSTSASSIHRFDSDNWVNYELIFTANHGEVVGVTFPHDFSGVFATAGQNYLRLWSAVDGHEMLRLNVANTMCTVVDFMKDGHSILSGEEVVQFKLNQPIQPARQILAWSDGRIRAFSPETGRLLYEIVDAHPKSVTAMATTSDCTRIVSGGKEGQVRVWIVSPSGHRMLNSMHDHKGLVSCIRTNHDSTKCVSSSEDGTCVIWDLEKYTRFQMVFANTLFKCTVFHPIGCQILTSGTDRKVGYWEVFNGQLCRHIYGSQDGAINALDITDDGKYFVTGGDERVVKIWRYHDGRLVATGSGHSGTITDLRISPDKKTICSVSIDGAILQWDLASLIAQDSTNVVK